MTRRQPGFCFGFCLLLFVTLTTASAANDEVSFNRDIRPILSDRCFKCHGPDDEANDSGVRLDLADEAYSSKAFVAGDVDASTAIKRILSGNKNLKMPPPDSHLELSAVEIELLKRWVEQGAKYDQHWAFKPLPATVIVPHYGMDLDWIQNGIDVFVMRSLDARKLEPTEASEKWRWLRRVTFDLTGLPPTLEEIEAFEASKAWDPYAEVVDRLLASSEFGKHMAVSWLDAARYADSFGYQSDQLSPTWPYRDWVVNAINDNLPYDDFLRWQIAGDLQKDASRDQILATAFNRLHRQTNEGGSVELEWRTEYVADRVNTFGTAMLGLTLECCRCHDHKFDPVTHQEYYDLFAYFNNIDEWGMYHDGSRVPTPSLLLPTVAQENDFNELESKLKEFRDAEAENEKMASERLDQWVTENQMETVRLNHLELIEKDSDDKPLKRPVGMVAYWKLDELDENNKLPNEVAIGSSASVSSANELVDGYRGKALKMTGDDAAEFPVPNEWLEPWTPFSISMWLKIPKGLNEAAILHRQGGTDVGNFGTKVSIEDGRLRFAQVRFWPGNAIAIESTKVVPTDEWVHIVVGYDGGGLADGMRIYINGENQSRVLRNELTKDPQYQPGNNPGFVVGEQFRRVGLKDGLVDEISFFTFRLSPVEVTVLRENVSEFNFKGFDVEDLKKHGYAISRSLGERSQVNVQLKELLQARTQVAETMVMREMDQIRPAYLLHRGEYDAPTTEDDLAIRGTPAALPALPDGATPDRAGLAEWLVDPNHPLTARVAVNRFWQGFFGRGLVHPSNDFGFQSFEPEHSRLLDWLARDFVDSEWDVKKLCKRIVLSSTYRQSSRCDKELRDQDPDNIWLARGPSQRLTAEMIRDMALFTSGLLNDKEGGPPVSPYQPENLWRENNTMTPAYNQSVGKDLYRRSLYTVWKRTTPMPNMMTFDATTRDYCTVQRTRTNTPQQAMVLLNDVQFVEAVRVLAKNAMGVVGAEAKDAERVQFLFHRLSGRKADEQEQKILVQLLNEQRTLFNENPGDAEKLMQVGDTKSETSDPIELAAMTILAQAIFNSDAVIWKR